MWDTSNLSMQLPKPESVWQRRAANTLRKQPLEALLRGPGMPHVFYWVKAEVVSWKRVEVAELPPAQFAYPHVVAPRMIPCGVCKTQPSGWSLKIARNMPLRPSCQAMLPSLSRLTMLRPPSKS